VHENSFYPRPLALYNLYDADAGYHYAVIILRAIEEQDITIQYYQKFRI